jgi:hypothetical protein
MLRNMVRRSLGLLAVGLAVGAVVYLMPASTPAIRDESGAVVPNSIASVESV